MQGSIKTEATQKIEQAKQANLEVFELAHNIASKTANLFEYIQQNSLEGLPLFTQVKADIEQNVTRLVENNPMQGLKELNKLSLCLDTLYGLANSLKESGKDGISHEVIKGGHLIICDGGKLYRQLKEQSEEKGVFRKRISSHHRDRIDPKDNHDIGIDSGLGELLVGVTKDGDTYLQLEGAPVKDIWSFIKHMLDFIAYKITGKNIGAYGSSIHTESNALYIAPVAGEPALAAQNIDQPQPQPNPELDLGMDRQLVVVMPSQIKLDTTENTRGR